MPKKKNEPERRSARAEATAVTGETRGRLFSQRELQTMGIRLPNVPPPLRTSGETRALSEVRAADDTTTSRGKTKPPENGTSPSWSEGLSRWSKLLLRVRRAQLARETRQKEQSAAEAERPAEYESEAEWKKMWSDYLREAALKAARL